MALFAGSAYVFAPRDAQAQAQRSIRFPLDGIESIAYTYHGKTLSFTPAEIFEILAVGKVEA